MPTITVFLRIYSNSKQYPIHAFYISDFFHLSTKSAVRNKIPQIHFYWEIFSALKFHYDRDILGCTPLIDIFHPDIASTFDPPLNVLCFRVSIPLRNII